MTLLIKWPDEAFYTLLLLSMIMGVSLQEGHCEALKHDECCKSTEVVNDDVDSSSSHYEREKLKEDGENEEMFGSMFAFSEEGINLKL